MAKLKYNLDEIKDFKIAPGKYRLKLKKVEQGMSKTKKPQLTWHWEIVSGSEKGKTLRYWSSLQENALGNLKNVLTAFGLDGKINTDTDRLIGKTIIAVVGDTTSVDKDGNERVFANILSMSVDKKAATVVEEEDDDDDVEDDDDDDDDDDEDDDDDDEDEPAPVKKKKAAPALPLKKKKKVIVDDDDDDDVPF